MSVKLSKQLELSLAVGLLEYRYLLRWEGLTQDEVRNKTPEQFRQWKDLSKKPDTSLRS